MQTFSERKRVQKLVYLMKSFGIQLDYSFGWYLHGPYSPDLTRELYDNSQQAVASAEIRMNPLETKRLDSLKDFLKEDIESSDSLELLVSLHYLLSTGREAGYNDKQIIEVLKQKKPFFSDSEISRCHKKILRIMK